MLAIEKTIKEVKTMKKLSITFIMGIIILLGQSTNVQAISTFTTYDVIVRDSNTVFYIDDSGRFNNSYDMVYFSVNSGSSVQEWIDQGYDTVKIYITIDIYEDDPGYQYIFIYRNDYQTETGNYLFGTEIIEHGGPGAAYEVWEQYTYVSNIYNLHEFVNDRFVIRYGASGFGYDGWRNRDLRVHFIFYNYT